MEVASIYKARAFIEQCIAIDPNFARAYVLLSQTQLSTWAIPLDDDFNSPAVLEAGYRTGEKAVQLDSNLPQARYQLGLSLSFKGQIEAAVSECERAVGLNPSYTDWRFITVLVHAGQYERAVTVGEAHLRLDPFTLPVARGWLGLAYYMLRRYPEAVASLREFLKWEDSKRREQKWPTFCGEIRVGHVGHANSKSPFTFSTKMPIIC